MISNQYQYLPYCHTVMIAWYRSNINLPFIMMMYQVNINMPCCHVDMVSDTISICNVFVTATWNQSASSLQSGLQGSPDIDQVNPWDITYCTIASSRSMLDINTYKFMIIATAMAQREIYRDIF